MIVRESSGIIRAADITFPPMNIRGEFGGEIEGGLEGLIRDIPDFPEPGIVFKDITPLLANPTAFAAVVDHFVDRYERHPVDAIVGVDARGFLLAAPVAYRLGLPLVPVRKAGKLPFTTHSVEYELEYGRNVVEMHTDALTTGHRVAILDDLLATGGTLAAAAELVEMGGGEVAELGVVMELGSLGGRSVLGGRPVHTLISV
jgi:adenine phosphoribosyltransferase